MTISTYRNLDGRLDQILPNDYSGYYYGDYLKEQSLRKQIKNLEKMFISMHLQIVLKYMLPIRLKLY